VDPLGRGFAGEPVYLKDLWPTAEEVETLIASSVSSDQFNLEYGRIFAGDDKWRSMPAPTGTLFDWDSSSTYVREPPYFIDFAGVPAPPSDVTAARVLALFGDSITTDHISPAGSITVDSPAGMYLTEHSVPPAEFNSFGSRRGNHEVMMRGTFGNIRLRNLMLPGVEGPWTIHVPTGERMSIYDAALRYQREDTPLIVIAGKEYGAGSSRDWAAKGSALLGVKAVIAQTYERIHRSNLVCLGVLPLQFEAGVSAQSLGLTGSEMFFVTGIDAGITPRQNAGVSALRQDGTRVDFQTTVRIDAPAEVEYFRHGGILQMVLRQLL
jgi:aconitate hydratase